MNKKTVPDFNTFQEARDFWDNNSLTDFKDDLELAKEVKFPHRTGHL